MAFIINHSALVASLIIDVSDCDKYLQEDRVENASRMKKRKIVS